MVKDVDEVVEYVQSSRDVDDLNLVKKEIDTRIGTLEKETIKVGEIAIVHFGNKNMFKRFNGSKVKVIDKKVGQYTISMPNIKPDGKPDLKSKPIEHRVPYSYLTKIRPGKDKS